jgi:hypothetical protein
VLHPATTGYGNNKSTFGAFLFTWPDGDMSQRPHKLPKVCCAERATCAADAAPG